jgi:hypothetical protein
MFKPLWHAFRAAVLATAVFWVATIIVDKIPWQAPLGLTNQLIFFVVFFLGVLMVEKK